VRTINSRLQDILTTTGSWLPPDRIKSFLFNLLIAALILIITYLLIKILSYALDRVFKESKASTGKPEASPFTRPVFSNNLIRSVRIFLKTLLLYGGYFIAAIFIFEVFNFRIVSPEDLKLLGISILKIIGVLVGARLVINLGQLTIKQLFEQHKNFMEGRKVQTLEVLLRSVLNYSVFFVAGLMILQVFNVNTSAILASAGILGLAIGFGAQSIVKDVIGGFFILLEDQFNVGDFVEAAGVVGTVEEIGLRTCKIRQWTGELHIIPNGEISNVTNYNRGQMLAVVTIGIAYEEDIDQAIEVLQQECARAYQEMESILALPQVQGVTELADSSVNIRAIAPAKPGEQWAVERELRRRFKYALDRAGIEIPYPRRVIISDTKTT